MGAKAANICRFFWTKILQNVSETICLFRFTLNIIIFIIFYLYLLREERNPCLNEALTVNRTQPRLTNICDFDKNSKKRVKIDP